MPQKGLNIPIVTALDDMGNIIETDQRNIVHYIIQQGRGADSLFISGTTGEFNHLSNEQRQHLLAICIEEIREANSALPESAAPVEAWAGATGLNKAETLENLELAKQLKADMAVISPLTIADLSESDIVAFFEKEIAAIVGADNPLVIGLYDNPDIASPRAGGGNISVPIISELRKLPFVVCLKASTSKEVLTDYIRQFSSRDNSPGFQIYLGNAGLVFELEEMYRKAEIDLSETPVSGVVSGTANLFPSEWKQAWKLAANLEKEAFDVYHAAFAEFESLTFFKNEGSGKLIACIKQAMFDQGIISSPCVAKGTPALNGEEAKQFSENLKHLLTEMRSAIAPQYLSISEERLIASKIRSSY